MLRTLFSQTTTESCGSMDYSWSTGGQVKLRLWLMGLSGSLWCPNPVSGSNGGEVQGQYSKPTMV